MRDNEIFSSSFTDNSSSVNSQCTPSWDNVVSEHPDGSASKTPGKAEGLSPKGCCRSVLGEASTAGGTTHVGSQPQGDEKA